MEESISVLCEPCGHNGITTCADTWCNDCEEGFCGDCIKGHQLSKVLRGHHCITISDYMKISSLSIDKNCPDHNKKYEFFCPQHDSILCLNCFQTNHSKCEISGLAEASKGSKQSTALADLERDTNSVLVNLKKAFEYEDGTLAHLTDQEQTIKRQIKETRENINAHLDKLQEQLLDELKKKFEKCIANLHEHRTTLKQREREMMTLKDRTSFLKNYASETQTFIGIKASGKTLLDQNIAVSSLLKNLSRPVLHLKIEDNVLAFLKDNKVLGKIEVNIEENQSLPFTDSLRKQAQINMPQFSDIANIKLQLNQSVKVHQAGKNMSLTSCALMPNNKMVFVDKAAGKIIVHSANGKHKTDLTVSGLLFRPLDVTAVNSSMIAVTKGSGFITMINIDTGKMEDIRVVDLSSYQIFHITFHREIFYAIAKSYGKDTEIIVIDLQGNLLHRIPVSDRDTDDIAVYENITYVICFNEQSLHALDKSGNKIWTFQDKRLRKPQYFSSSLAADNNGNVYVTLPDHDLVLLVSSDGQKHRVILDRSNQLIQPSGVSFLKETNQLLVCNRTNGHAAIYDVNG